ncbi:unnamed protein product [Amaranthus hypochondriacus]
MSKQRRRPPKSPFSMPNLPIIQGSTQLSPSSSSTPFSTPIISPGFSVSYSCNGNSCPSVGVEEQTAINNINAPLSESKKRKWTSPVWKDYDCFDGHIFE